MSCGLVSSLTRLLDGTGVNIKDAQLLTFSAINSLDHGKQTKDGKWSSVLPSIRKMSGMFGFVTEQKHLQISLAQFVRCNKFPS